MYANLIGYSDVTPFEVVRTATAKKMEIREMSAVRAEPVEPRDNHVAQRWTITPDTSAHTFAIRQHKDGQWRDTAGQRYAISDTPRRFYDLNF